jgi:NAD(P)-dependent dehydrogenase (short-subunit alcohol dehydrogenase family)
MFFYSRKDKNMKNFTGKVALVTGASSGIGRETALLFARAGATVVAGARRAEKIRELAGDKIVPVSLDVTRDDDVKRVVDDTLKRFGRVDILVCNAGVGHHSTLEKTRFADAEYVMDVNFFGAWRCIQAVLPAMKRQKSGQIVIVSSIVGHKGTPKMAAYCASKFALRGLADSLRFEVRDDGIDVIVVCPGYTETEFFDVAITYGEPWEHEKYVKPMPAAKAAAAILKACRARKPEVVLTASGKMMVWLSRFAPRLLDFIIRKVQR